MPLYEYECRTCRRSFEYLMRGAAVPECPSCQSRDLERKLSVFAARAQGAAPEPLAAGPCGRCGDPRGAGACSLN